MIMQGEATSIWLKFAVNKELMDAIGIQTFDSFDVFGPNPTFNLNHSAMMADANSTASAPPSFNTAPIPANVSYQPIDV